MQTPGDTNYGRSERGRSRERPILEAAALWSGRAGLAYFVRIFMAEGGGTSNSNMGVSGGDMGVSVGCGGRCVVYDCSQQEFVRVGYEIEEGVEIGFVLPFIEPVEVGAFFGAGLIFFFLFDE